MNKSLARIFLIALLYFSIPSTVFSQTAPFPPTGTPPCDGPFGSPCPIDGGIGFLIAAGIAYGGKKAYDLNQKS